MAQEAQVQAGPAARFGVAKGTLQDTGLRGFRTAFAAHGDPLTDEDAEAIHAMWYGRRTATEADLPLIERVEAIAQRILNAYAA